MVLGKFFKQLHAFIGFFQYVWACEGKKEKDTFYGFSMKV